MSGNKQESLSDSEVLAMEREIKKIEASQWKIILKEQLKAREGFLFAGGLVFWTGIVTFQVNHDIQLAPLFLAMLYINAYLHGCQHGLKKSRKLFEPLINSLHRDFATLLEFFKKHKRGTWEAKEDDQT